jgi:CheY-like chemotaxis protein
MESIGRLAGGIAHDFNNLLTAILGNVELAKSELPDASRASGDLDEIEKSAVRATKLTSQLLTFARRRVVEPQVVNLNEATAATETLLRRLISERVELSVRLEADPSHVRIDPGQFEQVIMNLAVNARDAMPGGGRLEIRTRAATPAEREEAFGGEAPVEEAVVLAVSDTGVGMEPEVMGRLFEPFFTTKAAGHGTGLGLAICYGIVGQAGGYIGVESAPGEGTTFKIILPSARSSEMAIEVEPVDAGEGRGSEVVLLVEDEDAVRRLVERALGQKGYEVLSAAHGDEAMNIVSSRGADIEVLITDIVMPRMGGLEVAALVKERVPGVKVLYISGYSDSEEAHRVIGTAGKAFLAKPFSPSELARRVRALCDGPALQDSA